MTTRLTKTLQIRTWNSAVKACQALVESDRLYQNAWDEYEDKTNKLLKLSESKYTEALAHAKKVIAVCEGE